MRDSVINHVILYFPFIYPTQANCKSVLLKNFCPHDTLMRRVNSSESLFFLDLEI
jgi:hypothetical protein